MFSNVNKTFSHLVELCKNRASNQKHDIILEQISIISFTDKYSRCALCVIKSIIRHGMKFTLKYPDVSGLFFDAIAGLS